MKERVKQISLIHIVVLLMLFAFGHYSEISAQMQGCVGLQRAIKPLEGLCMSTLDLAQKKHWISLEFKFQRQADVLGCEPTLVQCFCGGLLDNNRTKVSITPESASLNVGDKLPLSAKILQESCLREDGEKAGCFDICAGEPFYETLVGTVTWASDNPNIAFVDQNGLVKALKNGTATIYAMSTVFGNQGPAGTAIITVGEIKRLEVVFMYENIGIPWWIDCADCYHYPEWGNDMLNIINKYFDEYQIAIVTFAHHSEYFDPANSFCSFEENCNFNKWSTYEAYTPVLPFQFSAFGDTPAKVVAAYQSLTPTCQQPPGVFEYRHSTSLYTALMSVIDGSTLGGWWDEPTKPRGERVIIFLSNDGACAIPICVACDVEAISGLTTADVIRAAQAKNIRIFPIYMGASNQIYTNLESIWCNIAAQTGGTCNIGYPWCDCPGCYIELEQIVDEFLSGIASQRQ